jgi:hypothetical protein
MEALWVLQEFQAMIGAHRRETVERGVRLDFLLTEEWADSNASRRAR